MSIAAVRGFRDALPGAARLLTRIERTATNVLVRYGFDEIRLPIVERTELFARSIGEETDIVEKEMYTFPDRDGTLLTLRPEGTAPLVRAFVEHHLDQRDQVARLYYVGPMFRHERPQKGRHRQFYQVGAEVIGREDPLADAELLVALVDVLASLGIAADAKLLLNSIGDDACRPAYRERLREYGEAHRDELCENCRRRLATNPLRILDCKEPGCRTATADAPRIADSLCEPCAAHFAAVRALLDAQAVRYEIDPRLVRGLDYYVRTTFEVTAPGLGAQAAVGAGGRYDGLVAQLGGPPLSGIGFALGVERLALAVAASSGGDPEADAAQEGAPDVFIAPIGASAEREALAVARRLRAAGLRVELGGGRSLKSQMRRADRLGAPRVLILGDEEIAARRATLRDMLLKRDDKLAVDIDLSGPELLAAVGVRR
ncbi:MAG TPA: histidine--tRNA ligase [Candidatus Binatia bacterium]|nr:histidine--tRNA ligase [Candidatus Binatia bacterium]